MNRNTKPEISVIIPVYNAEKWISRCLESIIKQTFKNFEVIIVNDASQDKSFEIVKQYILKDDRIIIINKEKNEGTMSARESGYIKAKGKYIIFSDADDYFPQNAFQILYDTIITDKSDIVFGGYTIINNNMSQKNIIRYIPTNSSSEEIQNLFLEQKIPYTLWGNIYSTNLFKNHPIVSYSGITNAEDRMLFIQLISYAKKSSFTHHSCYCYYLNKESNSYPKISNRILKNIIFSNDWCYQYHTEKNVNPKYITKYHLYRIRYLMEIGYKFSDILSITSLDKTIYSLTSVYNNTNFIFSIHYLLLQKIKIYPKWYSHLKKLYYKLL